jgi:subfamily B ATP-binding cassette protein MsbA
MDGNTLTNRQRLEAVRHAVRFRPKLALTIVGLSLVAALLGGIGLGFILPIIELAQSNTSPANADGILGAFVTVYGLFGVPLTLETAIVGVTLAITIRYATSFIVAWLRTMLENEYVRDLRTRAFEGTLDARVAYFDRNGSDEILNAITTQADYAGGFIKNLLRFVETALVAMVFVVVALLVAPQLTLLTAGVFLAITLGTRGLFEDGESLGDRVATANERVQKAVQASTQGVRDVKLFTLEPEFRDRFEDAVDAQTREKIRIGRNQAGLNKTFQLASAVTVFLLLYLGLAVFAVPLSRLAVFLFAMFRLTPQVSSMNDLFYRTEGDLPHLVRTEQFVESLRASAEPDPDSDLEPGAADLPTPVSTVRFDEVSFAYEDELVLEDVTFELSRGGFVGFVGQSGAGKSTVALLLARLYAPDSGTIRADGVDIERVDVREWRSRVSVVRQQPWMFDDTLRYNLTVGARNATDEEIERACEIAQVTEFLDDLPRGYETEIGDDGVRLSGGQRQRVAIARAMLKEADFLVLDEATSDLDTRLERRVHDAISDMDREYGVVAIAHRFSAVRDADRIYTVEDGSIVETGTHEELLDDGGRYAKLYAAQAGGE